MLELFNKYEEFADFALRTPGETTKAKFLFAKEPLMFIAGRWIFRDSNSPIHSQLAEKLRIPTNNEKIITDAGALIYSGEDKRVHVGGTADFLHLPFNEDIISDGRVLFCEYLRSIGGVDLDIVPHSHLRGFINSDPSF